MGIFKNNNNEQLQPSAFCRGISVWSEKNKLEDRAKHTSESGAKSFLYGQGHGIIM